MLLSATPTTFEADVYRIFTFDFISEVPPEDKSKLLELLAKNLEEDFRLDGKIRLCYFH